MSVLILAILLFGTIMPGTASENFSEIWLLTPDNLTNFPFAVNAGQQYTVVLGVGNHMHNSEDYAVFVKLSNDSQNLPNTEFSAPSSLDALSEFSFSINNNEVWNETVIFSFEDFFIQDNFLTVQNISINNITFPGNFTTSLNSEKNGFDFNLFFELWRYNSTTEQFEFDNRYVGIWVTFLNSN